VFSKVDPNPIEQNVTEGQSSTRTKNATASSRSAADLRLTPPKPFVSWPRTRARSPIMTTCWTVHRVFLEPAALHCHRDYFRDGQ